MDEVFYYKTAVSKSPLRKYFTYKSKSEILPGSRVLVNFSGKLTIAYVLGTVDKTEYADSQIKDIEDLIDEIPLINEKHAAVADEIIEYYINPPGKVYDLFFSAAPKIKIRQRIVKCDSSSQLKGFYENEASLSVEKFFERTGTGGRRLLKEYLDSGIVELMWGLNQKSSTRKQTAYDLSTGLKDLLTAKLSDAGRSIVEYILFNGLSTYGSLKKNLNLKSKSALNTLVKNGLLKETQIEADYDSESIFRSVNALTPRQRELCTAISDGIGKGCLTHLIHGITGSGKTEVYFELMDRYVSKGKCAVFLLPEISLTPQLIQRVKSRFITCNVEVFHSMLSKNEREKVWTNVISGEADILLGTRSALWLPVKNPGIIIIDEEHDESYMQCETAPVYDAHHTARIISDTFGVPLIFGSATPRVETYFQARKGTIGFHEITERPLGAKLPEVEITDMNKEEKLNSILSVKLVKSMDSSLEKNDQVFILVGNKGYSSYAMCQNCGYIFKCTNCEVSMTRHLHTNMLKCHYCGYETDLPSVCPECGAQNITFRGFGTEKVEQLFTKLFPSKSILRMDRENITNYRELEKAFETIRNNHIDIVVGTKMISKGLDFPNVNMVGIINADQLLYFPDFRSGERTFQLISQMSGRAGRSNDDSKVVIQTTSTGSYPIACTKNHDYKAFYDYEIKQREEAYYPPFSNLILLTVQSEKYDVANSTSERIKADLELKTGKMKEVKILGPVQPLIPKVLKNHRFNILIKHHGGQEFTDTVKEVIFSEPIYEKNVKIIVDPIKMIV